MMICAGSIQQMKMHKIERCVEENEVYEDAIDEKDRKD